VAAMGTAVAALGADQGPAAPTETAVETPSPPREPRRGLSRFVAAAALALVAGLATVWWTLRPGDDPLSSRCVALATALAERQRSDGGFSGIPHAPVTGWDTAQQLAGLRRAEAGCGAPVGDAAGRASARLTTLRVPGGWAGAGRAPLVVATAWAALAGMDGAVDDLRAAQNPDGSFGWAPGEPGHPYATTHALLALPPGPAASAAAGWIVAEPRIHDIAGLDEEAFVALHRHGALVPGAAAALRERIRARCGDAACTVGQDAELPVPGGVVVTQWLPWAALATSLLGDDALHAAVRARLAATEVSSPGFVLGERLWVFGALTTP